MESLGHERLTASLVYAAEEEPGEISTIAGGTPAIILTQPVDSDSALDETAGATEVRILSVPELAVCFPFLLHEVETRAARNVGI